MLLVAMVAAWIPLAVLWFPTDLMLSMRRRNHAPVIRGRAVRTALENAVVWLCLTTMGTAIPSLLGLLVAPLTDTTRWNGVPVILGAVLYEGSPVFDHPLPAVRVLLLAPNVLWIWMDTWIVFRVHRWALAREWSRRGAREDPRLLDLAVTASSRWRRVVSVTVTASFVGLCALMLLT
jgi:hypothetical protein